MPTQMQSCMVEYREFRTSLGLTEHLQLFLKQDICKKIGEESDYNTWGWPELCLDWGWIFHVP